MNKIRNLARTWANRSALGRLVRTFYWLAKGKMRPIDISHLYSYAEEDACGPLQKEEALFLFSLVRTIRPKVIVEFGFKYGDSARNFLQAAGREGRVVSYDIAEESAICAERNFAGRTNFRFFLKSQTEFVPEDVGNLPIDLVFFDAAHDLDLNRETWRRVLPSLANGALVAIHDTGTWSRAHFSTVHQEFSSGKEDCWLSDDEFVHQPDERRFVNWIMENHPEFSAIHLHSIATVRHGLTLLQRRALLPVGKTENIPKT